MGLCSGGLIIGRIFASKIFGGLIFGRDFFGGGGAYNRNFTVFRNKSIFLFTYNIICG